MPSYPYKVRALAAIDTNFTPRHPTKAIPLPSIESTFQTICSDNNISIPATWRRRALITLDELVSDGWLVKHGDRNPTYTPAPRLRRIIADEKMALDVPTSNHDLKTFASVAKTLKTAAAASAGDVDNVAVNSSMPAHTPAHAPRRRSARFSLPASQEQRGGEGEVAEEAAGEEGSTRSPVLVERIVVRKTPASRKKSRRSDPGPRLVHTPATGSRRRSSGGAVASSSSDANTPATSQRKRSKTVNRRHTFAVGPARNPMSMSMPSGVSREIQFFPLKQALSRRTQRALRRNALSEEMNNIHAEESAARRKHREELMRLKDELAGSQQRLKELERELLAARHAPSEEPEHLRTVREESEPHGQDIDMEMGFDVGMGSMDFGEDHADDTPAHSPEPESRASSRRMSPAPLSRQASSNGGQNSPRANRDQRIRDLEAQISSLRDDIQRRAEEAQRWQEEAEELQEFQEFHDAEEQLLIDENSFLSSQVDELQSPSARRVTFSESETRVVGGKEEVETVVEESVFGEGASAMASSFGGGDLMDVEEEEEEESQPDPRIADLQADNEKLQQALHTLNRKIRGLEEENDNSFATSEEIRQKAEAFRKENDALRTLGDKLKAKLIQLERIEADRLQNVESGVVQTDDIIDEEKVALQDTIVELSAKVDELRGMHAVITEEKREIEVTLAECRAALKGLEHAVEVGSKVSEDSERTMENLRIHIGKLEQRLAEEENFKKEIEDEMAGYHKQIEDLTEEGVRLQEEVAEWRQMVTDKDEVIKALGGDMEMLKVRITGFESNVHGLEEELLAARKELESKDKDIKELESEIDVLQGDLEIRQDEIDDLRAEKLELEAAVDKLEAGLDDALRQAEDAEIQVEQKDREIEELAKSKGSVVGDNAEKERVLSGLEEERASLQAKAQDLWEQIEGMEDAATTLKGELTQKEQAVKELEEVKTMLEAELFERSRVIESLEERNAALSEELTTVAGNVVDLTQEKESLGVHVKHLESTAEELNAKVLDLDQNNLNLNGQLAQRTGEKTVLENKILGLDELNNALKTANELLQSDKIKLEDTIDDLSSASAMSDEENKRLVEKVSSLEGEISKLEAAAEAAEKSKEEFQDTISGLRNRISTLEKAADILQAEKESFERDIGQLKIRILELTASLEASGGSKDSLDAELAAAKAQIETFKQSAAAAAQEKEGMERQIAELLAEVEASKKAIRVLGGEKAGLHEKIEGLEEQIAALGEEVGALKAERELMRRDIANYQSRIADLEQVLDISQKNNAALKETIEVLEEKVESLNSLLESSNSANTDYLKEIESLNNQIEAMTRQAQTVEEEQSIIVQKIQPYIDAQQPLDMAVDEVLTELVMAKNRAEETESQRRQLEAKIRILAQDGDGKISPEVVIERLTDRFKEIRKGVEKLFNLRRQQRNSPYSHHNLEDFAWTGSNEQALKVIGTLIEDLDSQLHASKEHAKALQSRLNSENGRTADLEGFLDSVAIHLNITEPQPKRSDIPSFVEQYVLDAERKIESLEEKVEELFEMVESRDATIQALKADIGTVELQKSNLSQELIEAKASGDASRQRLSKAQQQIEDLTAAAEEDRMEIDSLEQQISTHKLTEQELHRRLDEQATAHVEELKNIHREKVVAVAAMENKLAEAVLGKNHLESRLAAAIEQHASRVRELEDAVARSEEQVQARDTRIAKIENDYQAQVDDLQLRIAAANEKITDLNQMLRDTETQAEMDIIALQTELNNEQKETAIRIEELEGQNADQKALARKLAAQLDERAAEIESLAVEIEELKRQSADYKEELESKIKGLERELEIVRSDAGKEKVRLEQIIQERELRIQGLEATETELRGWIEEADEKVAELDENIKNMESQHQIEAELVSRTLLLQKEEFQTLLERVQENLEHTQAELKDDNAALCRLVNEKKQQIEVLRAEISVYKTDKHNLELRISQLEADKRELEDDLEVEREKGKSTFDDMQQEVERFYSRFGDHKGQYLREQKHRESKSKKRSHAATQQQEEWLKEPTARPVTGSSSSVVTRKKRRLNGDSGIGIDPEDDEGFEGSVHMTQVPV